MKQNKNKECEYKVQSLERALDILECFSFQNREQTLSELAQKSGLNITTAKRLISNLTERGYLKQNKDKRYHLGLKIFELGGIVYSSFDLRKIALDPMNYLQQKTGATVLLGKKMGHQLVYIDKREGLGEIQISADIGWTKPLHYGMLGMTLMAYLDPKEVKEILERDGLKAYTSFSITDEDAFSLRLEEIRNRGYVVETDEAIDGVVGIAAPIKDSFRKVVAALGIALNTNQTRNGVKSYIDLVKEASDIISTEMGYLKI
jgi:DNA-binding IclR family transcriptional regulator